MSTKVPKNESKLTGKQIWEAQKAKEEKDKLIRPLWERSEDILSILRRKRPSNSTVSDELKERWYQQTQKALQAPRSFDNWSTPQITMESWFRNKFPEEERRFGSPFIWRLVGDGATRQAVRTEALNEEFFASMLGGEKGLGHQIVYCPGAGFWFWDPAVDAFCPTTDAKMEVLLSNYLLKYREAFRAGLDVLYLYEEHRKPAMLKRVVNKAKAILEADESFFQGAEGYARFVEGKRVLPQPVASPIMFIQSAVSREEGAFMTASEAYREYCRYCERGGQLKVTLSEFKSMAAPALAEKFDANLRHDIRTEDGRQTHGWKNIAVLPYGPVEESAVA